MSMALEDEHNQQKIVFAIEEGILAYRVMPFGLTNTSITF